MPNSKFVLKAVDGAFSRVFVVDGQVGAGCDSCEIFE
jgi:hypothetical protein